MPGSIGYSCGRVQINRATPLRIENCIISSHIFRSINSEIENAATINRVAVILMGVLMAPVWFQSLIGGPNVLWFINHSWAVFDEREKQNAASKKNGTVGSSGNTIPITPRMTDKAPPINQKPRMFNLSLVIQYFAQNCVQYKPSFVSGTNTLVGKGQKTAILQLA